MEGQPPAKDKRNVLKSDFLFACSLFLVCCLFVLGLITVPFWVSNQQQKIISANATSTAFVEATQQAKATPTTVMTTIDQRYYSYIDRFLMDSSHWFVGSRNNGYWVGTVEIKDGAYIWNVDEVKKTFVWWGDAPLGEKINNFDVTIDAKVIEGNQRGVCSGLIFRKSPDGWDSGGYTFAVCNDSHFEVNYHGKNGWEELAWEYSNTIQPTDWNRIQISARGDHFTLFINSAVVLETTDDRQKVGSLAIFIDIKEKKPAVIRFDNFGFQKR